MDALLNVEELVELPRPASKKDLLEDHLVPADKELLSLSQSLSIVHVEAQGAELYQGVTDGLTGLNSFCLVKILHNCECFDLHIFDIEANISVIVALLAERSIATLEVNIEHLACLRVFIAFQLSRLICLAHIRAHKILSLETTEYGSRSVIEVKVSFLTFSVTQLATRFSRLLSVGIVKFNSHLVESDIDVALQLVCCNFWSAILQLADDVKD